MLLNMYNIYNKQKDQSIIMFMNDNYNKKKVSFTITKNSKIAMIK